MYSGENRHLAVVVVDKKDAKVFVFGRDGKLRGAAPALLGSASGDHSVPGIGDTPIAQVLPAERTTPAGRFVAEPGLNANGEDVVWVDYEAAVSMHRVRVHVKAERRLQRLASQTAQDNRISFGCINVPVAFYEQMLSPMVRSTGAVVYVLPETQPADAFLGAYDVPASGRLAQQGARAPVRHAQSVGDVAAATPSVDAAGAVVVVGTAVAQSTPPNTPSPATGTSAGSGTSTPDTNATGTNSTSQQSAPLGSSGTSGAGSNAGSTGMGGSETSSGSSGSTMGSGGSADTATQGAGGTTRPMRADRN